MENVYAKIAYAEFLFSWNSLKESYVITGKENYWSKRNVMAYSRKIYIMLGIVKKKLIVCVCVCVLRY